MTLIAIVIAFTLELFASHPQRLRDLRWFDAYAGWLQGLPGVSALGGTAGVIVVLLAPLLLVGMVQTALHGVWFGLPELLLGMAALLYGLRYRSLDRLVDDYSEAVVSAEGERARTAAAELLERPVSSDGAGVREVAGAVLVQSNERLFSVLFWFAVLGPLGVMLYRLSWFLAERADHHGDRDAGLVDAARRLLGILAWLPARLAAVGYGLAGSFEDVVHDWRSCAEQASDDFIENTDAVLRQTGAGALQLERYAVQPGEAGQEPAELEPPAVKAARGLILRTLVVWVLAIALLTLAGWV